MKLAVILPSRGLVFSETMEELLDNLRGLTYEIYWSHGRPIPDCFEVPTQRALQDPSFTHLLVVEEDMVIPKGAVRKMLDSLHPVVAYDYPVGGSGTGCALYTDHDKAAFTGVGLYLIEMDIVRRMVFPIWRSDIAWNMKYDNGKMVLKGYKRERGGYGQQDVALGLRLYSNGIQTHIIGITAQRTVTKEGAPGSNTGFHEIIEETIKQKQPKNKVEIELPPGLEDWFPLK